MPTHTADGGCLGKLSILPRSQNCASSDSTIHSVRSSQSGGNKQKEKEL